MSKPVPPSSADIVEALLDPGNPEAIWKLVMAMKLNGLPKEALNLGFMAAFETKQFEHFWSLGYAELCKWSRLHD
jgi:hypothetical protein